MKNSTDLPNWMSEISDDAILIIENVGEDLEVVSKDPKSIILEGVCAVFGRANNNRRVYEKEEYLPHLTYLKEKIAKRQLTGDLDHPQHFDVKLADASHIIEGLEYDGDDKVNIRLRLLENTPNGKIAKALLDGGVNLSISSRSAGTVNEGGRVSLQRIFTYDLVGEPGFTEAILKKTVNESLQNEFQMITESYDAMKETSVVEYNHLEDISESLNFAENFKVYKINKLNKDLGEIPALTKIEEKNNKTMAEFVKTEQMDKYSEVLKGKFAEVKEELAAQRLLITESKNSTDVDTIKSESTEKLYEYIDYLTNTLEGVINFSDYLSTKVNESISYTQHVSEVTNNSIKYANHLGEELNETRKSQDMILEKVAGSVKYAEYLKENLKNSLQYQDYLAKELDKGLQYAEYIGEGTNLGIEYAESLAKDIQNNREFGDYLSEKVTQTIGYAEYITEEMNGNDGPKTKRNVLNGVSKVNESTGEVEKLTGVDALVAQVDNIITEVKSDSANAVLENRHPFLKVLSQENKDQFYKLDNDTRVSIVEALHGSVWFTEADVVSIMEAVINHKNSNIPNHVKFMPDKHKAIWNSMNESEKNTIHNRAQLYTLNTPYQVTTFWSELDLRGINERIEIEKNNKKLEQLNENSQSTEGLIPVQQVVESQRGYSQSYMDRMLRQAEYRK